jgi:hypothetical protein
MTEATEHNWQALAEAIILQAVVDCRRAARKLAKEPSHPEALQDKLTIEQFFRSAWFGILADLDGRFILAKLKRETIESEEDL